VYQGSFKDNVRHGKGSYTFKTEGCSYLGDWERDLKHGKGTFTWDDGTKFSGQWENGESKQGTLIEPNGTTRKI